MGNFNGNSQMVRKTGFSARLTALMCFVFLLVAPVFSEADIQGKGHLLGFIYDQDGVTPIAGVLVQVKNVSTGSVYGGIKSDINGMFKIEDLDAGVYTLGVSTLQGDFNLEELIGIKSGETTKVSFSLTPYNQIEAAAVEDAYSVLYNEEKIKEEVLVGKIISYNPVGGTAEVFIQKGYIKLNDRIRVRGDRADFYQDVKDLILGDQSVDKVFAGSTVRIKVKYAVEVGDLVYLVCKKRAVPFFLTPFGYITALAASGLITYGIIKITEEPCPECSVYIPPPSGTKKK